MYHKKNFPQTFVAAIALLASFVASGAEQYAERFVTPVGIHLLVDSIESVQAKFGTAPIVAGQGHHQSVMCYLWPKGQVRFLIGGEGIDASFELTERPINAPSQCVETSHAGAELPLEAGGLYLGMSEDEFMSLVKVPTEVKDGLHVADYSWAEALPTKEGVLVEIFVNVRVEGRFREHHLVELHVSKSAST